MQEHLVGLFDGVGLNRAHGAGFVIFIDKDRFIKGWLKARMGTNTHAKVVGIWNLLFSANSWGIKHLQVLGDSQVIINWAMGKA